MRRVTFGEAKTCSKIFVDGELIGDAWEERPGSWVADNVYGSEDCGDLVWVEGAKTRADAVRALLVLLRIEAEVC